jgi:hypothetical protein
MLVFLTGGSFNKPPDDVTIDSLGGSSLAVDIQAAVMRRATTLNSIKLVVVTDQKVLDAGQDP